MRNDFVIRLYNKDLNYCCKWIIVAFIFLPPLIISVYPKCDFINKGIKILAALISCWQVGLYFFRKGILKKVYVLLILGLLVWIEVSNMLNGYGLNSTAYYLVNSISIIGFVCVIFNQECEMKGQNFINTVILYCTILCLMNFVTQLVYVNDGIYHNKAINWQSYYLCGNPNSFGLIYLFSITLIYVQAENTKSHWLRQFGYLLNIIMIISTKMGDTSTGTVCLIICLIANVLKDTLIVEFFLRRAVLVYSFIIILSVWFIGFRGWKNEYVINVINNVVHEKRNLLSRGELWDYALKLIKNDPIFGRGAVVTKLSYSVSAGMNKSAHNTLLQITLFGGTVALVLYIVIIIIAIAICIRNKKTGFKSYLIGLFMYMLFFTFEQNPFYIGFYGILALMVTDYTENKQSIFASKLLAEKYVEYK